MSGTIETPTPPRRRRRWLTRIVGLIVCVLVLVAVAPAIVAKTSLRDRILNRILSGPVLAGQLSSESASLGWFTPIEFSGVQIRASSGEPILTGGTLSSSLTLDSLIQSNGEYGEFTLTHPTLIVKARPDGTNIEDLIAPIFATSDQPEPENRIGVVFRIRDGQLSFSQQATSPLGLDFSVSVPRPRSEPVTLTYQLTGTGQTSGELAFGTTSTARLTAQDFAIDSIAPLIPRFSPETECHGRVTADLQLNWGHSDGVPTLSIKGRTDVAELDLFAPGLGPDRVQLRQVGFPVVLNRVGNLLTVEQAKLACDVGVATLHGVVDLSAPLDQVLDRPGQSLSADVDLARLAHLVPNLLRLREGTELHSGQVTLTLDTTAGNKGHVAWSGKLDTQSLQGTRDGHPLAWEQPLRARFSGRTREDGMPVFDLLECQSDFAGIAARGAPESFKATAKIDLDRLTGHLREFVDLGRLQLSGIANVELATAHKGDGNLIVDGKAKLERFVIDDGSGGHLEEPQLDVTLNATGRMPGEKPGRIDTGTLIIGAGSDRLELVLQEPLVDVLSPQAGTLTGRLAGDLARWQSRLGSWVTIPTGWKFSGTTSTNLLVVAKPNRDVSVSATVDMTRFRFEDGHGQSLSEPAAKATLTVAGHRLDSGSVRLDSGTTLFQSGQDRLEMKILDPISDIRQFENGRFSAQIAGDMSQWRKRLQPWYALPKEWTLAGSGSVNGTITVTPKELRTDTLAGAIKSLRFHGIGLLVAEPEVKTDGRIVLDRQTGTMTIQDLRLSSGTASFAARSIALTPTKTGGLTGGGTVAVTANIPRVVQTVGLKIDDPSLAPTGLASGSIGFDLKPGGKLSFDSDLTVEKLVIGPEKNPTWSEPKFVANARGDWDIADEKLTLTTFKAGRTGLFLDGKGLVTDLSTATRIALDGAITYDLARLEPTLRNYLGRGATISGSGTRPFTIRGPLGHGGQNVAVNIGGNPQPLPGAPSQTRNRTGSALDQLTGNASVGWKAIKAFGFQVGPADMTAALANGSVKLTPIEATFGGGKVRVHPTLRLNAPAYDLTIAPGRIIEKANLTPEALDGTLGALGYALPALADVAQAKGQVSFDIAGDSRIPLVDVTKSSVKGTLTVHSAEVTPGPLVTEILTLLNADRKVLATAAEQSVPIEVKNGIVYHNDFKLNVGRSVVTTSGGVGLDGRLAIQLTMPFPPEVADTVFKNNPRIRDALLKQVIRVPVTGTVGKPQLESGAFRNTVQQLLRNATRDATGNLLGDLLRKGLGPQP